MALQEIHAPTVFQRFGEAVAAFFMNAAETSSMARAADARRVQIERLEAKTDAELAAMKLRRSDIAAYVFRDMMYI